ncbi:MAG: DUF4190 domain-containing protein [Planctomycetes bacterium]|nr:DUF4190 domain-containing protein [Planctomycetota bacterium]
MALFGRESRADQERAERVRLWAQKRSPFALYSSMLGVIAVVDFFTPIGFIVGIAAVVLGIRGLKQIQREPALLGRRLAVVGITLGSLGVISSTIFHIKFL